MHCTVALLGEYPLPDNFELKALMVTFVLNSHSFWTESHLPESYLLKRNSDRFNIV